MVKILNILKSMESLEVIFNWVETLSTSIMENSLWHILWAILLQGDKVDIQAKLDSRKAVKWVLR